MRYDWVIFDLDGTLTPSEEGIIRSASYALEKMGFPVPEYAEMKRFIGPPLHYSFKTFIGMTDEQADEAVQTYRERYSRVGWAENSVYTGIPAMLKALKRAGVKLGVATGKPQVFTEKILERFGLRQYFDTVCGISDGDRSADKVALITRALGSSAELSCNADAPAEKAPASPARACMVGDRKFDIEAARKLGLDAVGVLYGYGGREELETAGATHIAETPDALSELLLGDLPREKGLFLSFEGSDGCGKTTQKKFLAEWLKTCGWRVKETREPGGGPISEAIRALVLDPEHKGMTDICEAYLFAASRAQHVRDTIRPALDRGEVVLCDRFLDSSVAFQGAGRMLGTETVMEINRHAVDGTLPDMTIFLDIDPHTAMQRRLSATAPDRIEQEKQDFVDRVYNAFGKIADENPQRVARIPATGTIEEIRENISQTVLNRLAEI